VVHVGDLAVAGDVVALHDGIGRGTFHPRGPGAHELRARRLVELQALPAALERVLGRGVVLLAAQFDADMAAAVLDAPQALPPSPPAADRLVARRSQVRRPCCTDPMTAAGRQSSDRRITCTQYRWT
jgi:hypothetical protein